MMIHQQPLPPQELPHIIVTSKKDFVTAFAVHSMLFRRPKKVQRVFLGGSPMRTPRSAAGALRAWG